MRWIYGVGMHKIRVLIVDDRGLGPMLAMVDDVHIKSRGCRVPKAATMRMMIVTMRMIDTALSANAGIVDQPARVHVLVVSVVSAAAAAAAIAAGRAVARLLGLNDDDVFIADNLDEKGALLLITLETVVLGVMVESEANDDAHDANETFAAVDEHGNDDVDVFVLFLKRFAKSGKVDETNS